MTNLAANSTITFIPGRAGDLLAVHTPARDAPAAATLVVAPAFAEEMNRSRRMIALLARSLAGAGVATLEIDLFGCGDSAGEFRDARWETWIDDLGRAIERARADSERVHLLGVRLGALLALEVARRYPVDDLLLWQPAISGRKHLRDFLFQRVMAGMMQKDLARTSIEKLRARLAAGETVEIGGYDLAPELYAAVDALEIDALRPAPGQALHWLEVSQGDEAALKPDSRRVVEAWRGAGLAVRAHPVSGHAFWVDGKVKVAPALVDFTASLFAGGPA